MSTLLTIDTLSRGVVFNLHYNGIVPEGISQPWNNLLRCQIPRAMGRYGENNNIEVNVSRNATLLAIPQTFIYGYHGLDVSLRASDSEQSIPGTYAAKMAYLIGRLTNLQEEDYVLKIKGVYSALYLNEQGEEWSERNESNLLAGPPLGELLTARPIRIFRMRSIGSTPRSFNMDFSINPENDCILPLDYLDDSYNRRIPPAPQATEIPIDLEASTRMLRESFDRLQATLLEQTSRLNSAAIRQFSDLTEDNLVEEIIAEG